MSNSTKVVAESPNKSTATEEEHTIPIQKMEQQATTSSSISEESAIRQLEQARREVEEIIQDDSVDDSVRQAAARRLKRAELQYQNVVFHQAQVNLQGHADERPQNTTSAAKDVENAISSDALVSNRESNEYNPVLTNNDPVELARITSDDVAFLEQHQDEVDKSVVEAALRKAEKATRSLSLTGVERHNNLDNSEKRADESDDEETNSGFEDSSLLEPFQTNGQKVTIDVIPISDDIDLEALGNAISEVEREEQWLESRRIIKAAVGSKLILRLNKTVSIKEVDWICDRLTDEFPDDIQSLEVKFHPTNNGS